MLQAHFCCQGNLAVVAMGMLMLALEVLRQHMVWRWVNRRASGSGELITLNADEGTQGGPSGRWVNTKDYALPISKEIITTFCAASVLGAQTFQGKGSPSAIPASLSQ